MLTNMSFIIKIKMDSYKASTMFMKCIHQLWMGKNDLLTSEKLCAVERVLGSQDRTGNSFNKR